MIDQHNDYIENNVTKEQKTTRSNSRPDKGQYGYIDYTKKKLLIMSLISLATVLVIFFTGVIIYKTNKSLFSIIAAVATLPTAKLITGYIVLRPYKTEEQAILNKLKAICEKNKEYEAIIGADFVISSSQNAMNIAFAYIINGKVICYTSHHKTDAKETEKYIREIFDNNSCQYSQVRVFDEEKKFLKAVEYVAIEIGKEYTDKRLCEKLCAYSM